MRRQGELFPAPGGPAGGAATEVFDLPDAELRLIHGFLPPAFADRAFAILREDTDWQQERAIMFGRDVAAPRLTAWYGDPGSAYVYSGVRHDPLPWTKLLGDLRGRVEEALGRGFNSVLLNYYRDGHDSVGWHADDEPELGAQPVIGSLSLGAKRVFQLRHRERADLERVDIELDHGSLLLMGGDCQRCWKHQLPKRRGPRAPGPRINLTFRQILRPSGLGPASAGV